MGGRWRGALVAGNAGHGSGGYGGSRRSGR